MASIRPTGHRERRSAPRRCRHERRPGLAWPAQALAPCRRRRRARADRPAEHAELGARAGRPGGACASAARRPLAHQGTPRRPANRNRPARLEGARGQQSPPARLPALPRLRRPAVGPGNEPRHARARRRAAPPAPPRPPPAPPRRPPRRPGAPPVALVGWSLGGTVAREIARAVPQRVACVVTFGSPVIGGPTHTIGARTMGRDECERIDALIRRLAAEQPIEVPVTTIYTRRDGV